MRSEFISARVCLLPLIAAGAFCSALPLMAAEPLKVGIIGCDTSHVPAFTKLINAADAAGPLADVQVTCAFPGGSPDIPSSRDRVGPFTDELRAAGVEIVDSVKKVVDQSDAILLESVDGRVHLEQFRQAAQGKPVFIDKPAAASLTEVIEIFRIAKETNTPCFSSSALRFSTNVTALAKDKAIGKLNGCSVASPYQTEPHHPDLFWYGVHGVESVFTLMGPGCESVTRVEGRQATVVVGKWKDGRTAAYHGLKESSDYAFTAFGATGVKQTQGFSGYEPLVEEICKFFLTGKPPVTPDETVEIFAFMEAADESLRQQGRPVMLKDVVSGAEHSRKRGKASSTSNSTSGQ